MCCNWIICRLSHSAEICITLRKTAANIENKLIKGFVYMYLPENTMRKELKVYLLLSFLRKAYSRPCFKMAASSLIKMYVIDDGK